MPRRGTRLEPEGMQNTKKPPRRISGAFSVERGQRRGRTADLAIFSRSLYQLSYLALGKGMATPTGLEPATSAVTRRRANQLRYGAS